jgi:hypothetical protein
VSQQPVSDEIAGALGWFFHGGAGPSHGKLTSAFLRSGYSDADIYRAGEIGPNKETRVQSVIRAAVRRPARARELVDGILALLRVEGHFSRAEPEAKRLVAAAQAAFRRVGWSLSDDGVLSATGDIDLDTGGRQALDEQLDRLRRSTDDPALLLGSAKDLLEAVAKFVLEELGHPVPDNFNQLLFLARERLGIHPSQVDSDSPGHQQVRKILGASWTIAEQVNELRNLQGTGHGRTLPTGVTPDIALLVVREACSIASFLLGSLDRYFSSSFSPR